MFEPVKVGLGEFLQGFYAELVPTTKAMHEFVGRGYSYCVASAPSRQGRPSILLRLNPTHGYFIGASAGSAVGSAVWLHWGWTGASVAGLILSLATLAVVAWDRSLARQPRANA